MRRPNPYKAYKGGTALVTGASAGIGDAFAHALAARGSNLILVARSEDKLRATAERLTRVWAVRVEVIVADLSQPEAVADIERQVRSLGMTVDLLVNNAGFGTHGHFEQLDPAREREEIQVNVAALVDLTHAFLPPMVARGRGGVINVASTAGFQPLPYMAVYGATKAFVLSFSQALSEEYRNTGVRILALCPGATETEFFKTLGTEDAAVGPRRTSLQVVKTGLRAWSEGKSVVVDGFANAFVATAQRFLPRSLVTRLAALAVRPGRTGK
jgi:short-subunit dehydrogenase